MTPAEMRLRRRLMRQVAQRQPEVARLILGAFDSLSSVLDSAALERLIRESGLGAAGVLSDEAFDEAFGKLRTGIQGVLRDGTISAARFVAGVDPNAVFNVLNPNVLQAARALDSRVIRTLTASVRDTFRDELLAGLRDGVNPRLLARRLRDTIGMAPNQAQAVRNFERMLTDGNVEALTRKLRDRRFDRTLFRALGKDGTGLSKSQIERMTSAYRRRMIAFNAEVNARTATLDAMRAGQRLSWDRAIELGVVDRSRLMKKRITVGDDRVRSEHVAINNQVRRFDEFYSNGEMVVGDQSFQCRCIERMFQAKPGEVPLDTSPAASGAPPVESRREAALRVFSEQREREVEASLAARLAGTRPATQGVPLTGEALSATARATGAIGRAPVFATSSEAEAWASTNLATHGVSYRGLSVGAANEINTALSLQLDRAGLQKLRSIRARPDNKIGAMARMSRDGDLQLNDKLMATSERMSEFTAKAEQKLRGAHTTVELLESHLGDLDRKGRDLLESAREIVKFKRLGAPRSIGEVVTHEFGHYLELRGHISLRIDDLFFRDMVRDAVKEAGESQYRYKISQYAFANPETMQTEVFAEVYTLWTTGRRADVPPRFARLFERFGF